MPASSVVESEETDRQLANCPLIYRSRDSLTNWLVHFQKWYDYHGPWYVVQILWSTKATDAIFTPQEA